MHARTEIDAAEILSLLYHSTPSCGVFNFFLKKIQKYHASQDGGIFKKFEKKNKETTPQLGVVGYNKDNNLVTFEGIPQLQVGWYQKI